MFEFVEHYKKIKVGSKIQIKAAYLLYGRRQVSRVFIDWIRRYRNVFVVESIQEIGTSAMIVVEEVSGYLEHDQVLPLKKSKRVLNWHKEKKS